MSHKNKHDVLITLDTDWAPDFAIQLAARILTENKIKATWFITHDSEEIQKLLKNPLFEVGIHPNFLPNSTQGKTEEEILQYCMRLVPNARCMRTHGLYQYSNLLVKVLELTPIRFDSSIYLPRMANIIPLVDVLKGKNLVRVPYFWTDDVHLANQEKTWDIEDSFTKPGVNVFNFHPLHIYLNSCDMTAYEYTKKFGDLTTVKRHEVEEKCHQGGGGVLHFFKDLVAYVAAKGPNATLSEIAERYIDTTKLLVNLFFWFPWGMLTSDF